MSNRGPSDGAPAKSETSDAIEVGVVKPGDLFVDKYRIVRVIAVGGFGEVYEAVDEFMRRPVAIKILKPAKNTPQSRLRNQAEAVLLCKLDHKNIVKIFTAGILPDGKVWMVMELLAGSTLREKVFREGPLPVAAALAIGADIADAVAAAHEQGAIHRDLKPENVFITSQGEVKVLDFGSAKIAQDTLEGMKSTEPGKSPGTPAYMSPEQCVGNKPTLAVDIYGIGLILWEMLEGHHTWANADGTLPDGYSMYAAQINRPPPPLGAHVPHYAGVIVEKALQKKPEDRYARATDLSGACRAAFKRLRESQPHATTEQAGWPSQAGGRRDHVALHAPPHHPTAPADPSRRVVPPVQATPEPVDVAAAFNERRPTPSPAPVAAEPLPADANPGEDAPSYRERKVLGRLESVKTVAQVNEPRTRKILEGSVLRDADPRVRAAAAKALIKIGDAVSVVALRGGLLGEMDAAVRLEIESTIKVLDPRGDFLLPSDEARRPRPTPTPAAGRVAAGPVEIIDGDTDPTTPFPQQGRVTPRTPDVAISSMQTAVTPSPMTMPSARATTPQVVHGKRSNRRRMPTWLRAIGLSALIGIPSSALMMFAYLRFARHEPEAPVAAMAETSSHATATAAPIASIAPTTQPAYTAALAPAVSETPATPAPPVPVSAEVAQVPQVAIGRPIPQAAVPSARGATPSARMPDGKAPAGPNALPPEPVPAQPTGRPKPSALPPNSLPPEPFPARPF